ncbi:MAG: acyl carrier protein [Clostridiales bacterium]|jgi:acyl carrier protein|nr:acyl carrier protein [Clostridiales bacterium]
MEFEKIREIVAEHLGKELDEITMETNFTEDLGADSLDLFQIISELEEIFEGEFSEEDAMRIATVGDAVEYVKKLRT